MRDSDDRANAAAKFFPAGLDSDGETRALPCIEVGGVQVYAYADEGVLRISAHFDEADPQVFDFYSTYAGTEPTKVPVTVDMDGISPVFAALPDGREA